MSAATEIASASEPCAIICTAALSSAVASNAVVAIEPQSTPMILRVGIDFATVPAFDLRSAAFLSSPLAIALSLLRSFLFLFADARSLADDELIFAVAFEIFCSCVEVSVCVTAALAFGGVNAVLPAAVNPAGFDSAATPDFTALGITVCASALTMFIDFGGAPVLAGAGRCCNCRLRSAAALSASPTTSSSS
jgi:hypothetical protein